MCYEDALVVNKTSVKKSLFDVKSCLECAVDSNCPVPMIGDAIAQKEHPWWEVPHDGRLLSVRLYGFNTRVKASYSSRLLLGDKLSTPHGQKAWLSCHMTLTLHRRAS
jgi:hypothetical protein